MLITSISVAVAGAVIILKWPGAPQPPQNAAPATSIAVDRANKKVDSAGGTLNTDTALVSIDPGSVKGSGQLSITPADVPSPLGDSLQLVGPVVDIHLTDATLVGPLRVTLSITAQDAFTPVLDSGGTAVTAPPTIIVVHFTGGEWVPLETTIDSANGTATAFTPSLSVFGLVKIAGKFLRDLTESTVNALTGGLASFVPEPKCEGADQKPLWEATPADSPISWCAARKPDGTTVVQAVNRRRYAVTVIASNGGTVTGASSDLAAQISQLASQDGTVVIGPGEAADIVFPQGTDGPKVQIEFDGLAQTMTSLLTAADIMAAVAARLPFSKATSGKQFLDLVDASSCLTGLGIDWANSAKNPPSLVVKIVTKCLTKKSLGILGAFLASPIVLVASLLAYFVSAGSALFDLIVGGANGTLAGPVAEASQPSTTANSSDSDIVPPLSGRAVIALLATGETLSDNERAIVVYDASTGSEITSHHWRTPLSDTFTIDGVQMRATYADPQGCATGGASCAHIFSPDFSSVLASVTAAAGDSSTVPAAVKLSLSPGEISVSGKILRDDGFAANPKSQTNIDATRFLPDGRIIYVESDQSRESSPGIWTAPGRVYVDGEKVLDFTKRGGTGLEVAPDGTWSLVLADPNGDTVYMNPAGNTSSSDPLLEPAEPTLDQLQERLVASNYTTNGHGDPVAHDGSWAFLATPPGASQPSLFTLAPGSALPAELVPIVPSGVLLYYGLWTE